MLIAQKLLSSFHFVLKVHGFYTTILYKRATNEEGENGALGHISLNTKSAEKFPLRYKVSVAYTLCVFLQIVHAVKFNGAQEKVSLVALVPSILFLLSLFFHLPTLREHYKKQEEFCPLFNAFLEFERKYNGKYTYKYMYLVRKLINYKFLSLN